MNIFLLLMVSAALSNAKPVSERLKQLPMFQPDRIIEKVYAFYGVDLYSPLLPPEKEYLAQMMVFSETNHTGLSRCLSLLTPIFCYRFIFYDINPGFNPEAAFDLNEDEEQRYNFFSQVCAMWCEQA